MAGDARDSIGKRKHKDAQKISNGKPRNGCPNEERERETERERGVNSKGTKYQKKLLPEDKKTRPYGNKEISELEKKIFSFEIQMPKNGFMLQNQKDESLKDRHISDFNSKSRVNWISNLNTQK